MMEKVFAIRGSIKNYEWGKISHSSTVSNLIKSSFADFVVENVPYAELWMGTHSSGPSKIPHLNDVTLLEWINKNPDCLGSNITNTNGPANGLPFLFKVLSVNKALSIQVHPNKKTAEKLHKEYPQHYPDDNHKPEMAIALTEFKALCGFRPLNEIKEFFEVIPQLTEIVPDHVLKKFLKSDSTCDLKTLFTAIMTSSKEKYEKPLSAIAETFKENSLKSNLCRSVSDLFLKIYAHYPNDIGCYCIFFLNYLKLRTGQAIFLAANEPHAYLEGDCVECMACSDNVVRAGLTPKFRDIETLCNILTYNCKSADENIFPYTTDQDNPYLKMFKPPVKEFAIDVISIEDSCKTYILDSVKSASILLVTKGTGIYISHELQRDFCPGSIVFIASDTSLQFNLQSNLLMFRCYCNA